MKFNKNKLLLYAITDPSWVGKQSLYEQIEEAILGGITILQLREKKLSEEKFLKEAIEIKKLCNDYNIPLIINDNVNVALISGADGVHVGLQDTPIREIRKKVGQDFIIGATAKTVEQALAAENAGADYLGVGAVFPSPTKKDAIGITIEELKEITSSVSIPTVAIGGISINNINELKDGGMYGIALSSAIFSAKNIRKATTDLRELSQNLIGILKN